MIKTHREKVGEHEYGTHFCYFCEEKTTAAYWTQNEFPDGERQHPVIWHCQNHRDFARYLATKTAPVVVCGILAFEDNGFTDYIPPSEPIKTRPITGLNVSTKAGVYRVEFYRDNAIRCYKVTTWKRVVILDSLLKKYCEVAEVNLFSCGQVFIWYNMSKAYNMGGK